MKLEEEEQRMPGGGLTGKMTFEQPLTVWMVVEKCSYNFKGS